MHLYKNEVRYILATDVGSTTTKARFFMRRGGEYRYVASGEAPTTVEKPYENVIMGLKNSIREVEELTGHKILSKSGEGIIIPSRGNEGVDIYVSTSSAGGGLQMLVAGVVRTMTAESAERAALGAGAIVMDTISLDDNEPTHEKIQRIRYFRPDMFLLAGGTDGGTVSHVVELAELLRLSDPKPRLGIDYKLPVVYAGNKFAIEHVKKNLEDKFMLKIVDNIRPTLEIENVEPARKAIHELFMEHVMSHAPGYPKLMKWTSVPIMPTPAGEGKMMQLIAKIYDANVLGVGLGGATTNIYSVYDGKFVRSVSANLGMSYSICNVKKEAGMSNIMRWIPFTEETYVRDMLVNKMIRPTTIPQTLEELIIEHAVAREAIRLGFMHHKSLARELKGVHRARGLEALVRKEAEETYIKMMNVDIIVGTGGLLSHAPRRVQSMLIMIDAFQPEGITRIFQDSVFMMPHLGVLSTVHEEAAIQIFKKDCLVRLGTVIAPRGQSKEGSKVLDIELRKGEEVIRKSFNFGEIEKMPLNEDEEVEVLIKPTRRFDVGKGFGRKVYKKIKGGVVGIVFDCRGRPLNLPKDKEVRRKKLIDTFKRLDVYPSDLLKNLEE